MTVGGSGMVMFCAALALATTGSAISGGRGSGRPVFRRRTDGVAKARSTKANAARRREGRRIGKERGFADER